MPNLSTILGNQRFKSKIVKLNMASFSAYVSYVGQLFNLKLVSIPAIPTVRISLALRMMALNGFLKVWTNFPLPGRYPPLEHKQ